MGHDVFRRTRRLPAGSRACTGGHGRPLRAVRVSDARPSAVAPCRALLAEGTAPSTAAAEAGFADQAHLTRWFTRTYGVTPAAYRTTSTTPPLPPRAPARARTSTSARHV
ncbi:helix-turn-helix domain-containing protein [Streptomyces sp. NPDC002577]